MVPVYLLQFRKEKLTRYFNINAIILLSRNIHVLIKNASFQHINIMRKAKHHIKLHKQHMCNMEILETHMYEYITCDRPKSEYDHVIVNVIVT